MCYYLALTLDDSITRLNKEVGRVYFASISDIQLDVSPSKIFWMQNRTKAWGLYYFPSSWMYPLDVQNGCALEHSLKVNSVSHPMKTSHPIQQRKHRYIGLKRMSPIWGSVHFCVTFVMNFVKSQVSR